jgi:hypothetical protein
MCVILVCPPNVRPSREVITACAFANPDGAGFAWKCGPGSLAYEKGLEAEELPGALEGVPASAELVIHFRLTSQGPTHPALCHPFPVRRTPGLERHGTARELLFHNGTWPGYRDAAEYFDDLYESLPARGLYSDTYVIAAIVARQGPKVLRRLPGRFVHFTTQGITLHGDWQFYEGMRVSNLFFTHWLRTLDNGLFWPENDDFR